MVVAVKFSAAINDSFMSGLKGAFKHSLLAKANLDADWSTPGSQSVYGGNLSIAASTGEALSYLAGSNLAEFYSTLQYFPQVFLLGLREVRALNADALLQLYDPGREDSCLCGSFQCHVANVYYDEVRIEGYQPKPTDEDAVRLNIYWSPTLKDK